MNIDVHKRFGRSLLLTLSPLDDIRPSLRTKVLEPKPVHLSQWNLTILFSSASHSVLSVEATSQPPGGFKEAGLEALGNAPASNSSHLPPQSLE